MDWKDGHRDNCRDMKIKCKLCLIRNPLDYHEKGLCVHCGELFCHECIMKKKFIDMGVCPACNASIYNESEEVCFELLMKLEKRVIDDKELADRIMTYLLICIGGRYYRGDGVKQDYDKAEEYYLKAVERGSKVAHYNLYCLYEDMEKDREVYMSHLMIAVEDKYAAAELTYSLELMVKIWDDKFDLCQKIKRYITRGDIIQLFIDEPDLQTTCLERTEESYLYLKKAALSGNPDALFELGISFQFGQVPDHAITRDMTNTEKQSKLHKLVSMSIIWYKKATEKGHSMAANNLGVIYKNGMGCIGDIEKAKGYYKTSHFLGCVNGTYGLGTIYELEAEDLEKVIKTMIDKGREVKNLIKEKNKLYRTAADYYAMASKRGFMPAQGQLGIMMVTNRFNIDDEISRIKQLKDGIHLIRDAAEQGCSYSKRYLDNLKAENGDGPLSKDIIDPYDIN